MINDDYGKTPRDQYTLIHSVADILTDPRPDPLGSLVSSRLSGSERSTEDIWFGGLQSAETVVEEWTTVLNPDSKTHFNPLSQFPSRLRTLSFSVSPSLERKVESLQKCSVSNRDTSWRDRFTEDCQPAEIKAGREEKIVSLQETDLQRKKKQQIWLKEKRRSLATLKFKLS